MTENYSAPEEPTVTYISSERDVLALALHLLGYWPEQSILLLALSDGGAGPLMRVDMPDISDVAPDDFLTYLFGAFPTHSPSGDPINSVFLLLFAPGSTSGTANAAVESPFIDTAQQYATLAPAHAQRHGLNVLDVLAIGQQAYWAVNPAEGQLAPAGFLDDVLTSPLYAELVTRGSCVANDFLEAQKLKRWDALQTQNPQAQESWQVYAEAASTLYQHNKEEENPDEAFQIAGELELWEQAIDTVTSLLDNAPGIDLDNRGVLADSIRATVLPDLAGFLITSLSSLATLQLVIFQACRSLKDSVAALETLAKSSEELGINHQPESNRVLPLPSTLHRYQLNHLSQPESYTPNPSKDTGDNLSALAQTLFGLETLPPCWKRLDALACLAAVLEGSATGKAEGALVAAQAWMSWMRGNSTEASHLLETIDNTYIENDSLPLHYLLTISAFPAWLTLPGGTPGGKMSKNSE